MPELTEALFLEGQGQAKREDVLLRRNPAPILKAGAGLGLDLQEDSAGATRRGDSLLLQNRISSNFLR